MSYKERLRKFNSTEKYMTELDLLNSLVDGSVVLDYGCGLGTAMKYLHSRGKVAFGYDVNDLYEWLPRYLLEKPEMKVDTVYFMHSFNHIENIQHALDDVKMVLRPGGAVVIISPNPEWLEKQTSYGYVPDPTVVKHYSLDELAELLPFRIEFQGQFGQRKGEVNERIFIKARV